jgi:hypothetical protein
MLQINDDDKPDKKKKQSMQDSIAFDVVSWSTVNIYPKRNRIEANRMRKTNWNPKMESETAKNKPT